MPSWANRLGVLVVILFSLTNSIHHASAQVSLTPSAKRQNAGVLSRRISPSYAGFGIEPSNLLAFTGTTSPNQLTVQLISNLANNTGAPPFIRVGGNAGDLAVYDPNETSYYFEVNPSPTGNANTDHFLFGPNYFRAINHFPQDTPLVYGLNLAYSGADAVSRIVQQAGAAFQYIDKHIKLFSLEIGNEPDLFIPNGFRPSTYTAIDFGKEWSSRAKAIYTQVLQPRNISTNFFEPPCTATTATKTGQQYRIANLVSTDVATDNGIYVAGWNQHDYYYYVNVSDYTLTLDLLMDLSITTNQFHEWTNQAEQASVTGKPYYLREMGSVGPEGIQGISDTFGNAIWTLNFFLFAATVQVSAVQIHLTQSSMGSPWQPIAMGSIQPHVRPSYYAWAAFSQITGAGCNPRIGSVSLNNVPADHTNRLAAYSVYHNDDLSSVVLINSKPVYSSNSYNAPSVNFQFSLPSLSGRTLFVATMSAAAADSTSNATWNGISYELDTTGRPVVVDSKAYTVQVAADGSVTVPVRDSQIVTLSTLRLGTTTPDLAACANPTTTTDSGDPTETGPVPTFKSTSGFKAESPLSEGAIIAISVGGGVFVLALIGLIIFFSVKSWKKKQKKKQDLVAVINAPPRHDDRPLLTKPGSSRPSGFQSRETRSTSRIAHSDYPDSSSSNSSSRYDQQRSRQQEYNMSQYDRNAGPIPPFPPRMSNAPRSVSAAASFNRPNSQQPPPPPPLPTSSSQPYGNRPNNSRLPPPPPNQQGYSSQPNSLHGHAAAQTHNLQSQSYHGHVAQNPQSYHGHSQQQQQPYISRAY